MCRICGFWDFSQNSSYDAEQVIISMRDTMAHGGPDYGDHLYISTQRLALGHRRLSIIDLSNAGAQPMSRENVSIVFNGEIYNYKSIQKELISKGHSFSSNSDTEIILNAFYEWGIDMIHRLRGMFAIVIWDGRHDKLYLFRDRLGVKPLYWYFKEGLFMFTSELKSFHKHPLFEKKINHDAVNLYLQQGYIQHPHSIFAHAHKLSPGNYLTIDKNQQIKVQSYWNIHDVYSTPNEIKPSDQVDFVESKLLDSFALRMVSDVPVGAFLSGGIDSSLLVSLLTKVKNHDLKTFTIGFHDKEYDESPYAKEIAKIIGTDHTELICTEKDFEDIIPLLPTVFDEPFGDSSAIPTLLVSKLAKQQVKVSLSSDGGDELFGGYTKYQVMHSFYDQLQRKPKWTKNLLKWGLQTIDPFWLEKNAKFIPILNKYKNLSNKLPKLKNALLADSKLDFFNISSSYIERSRLSDLMPSYSINRYTAKADIIDGKEIGYWGMIDIDTYLEGDILPKVDRTTMSVALEGRDPFLDHELVECAMMLNDDSKIKKGTTKWVLRQILHKHIPTELIDRPKQGFSIPIDKWLRFKLKNDIQELKEDKQFCEHMGISHPVLSKIVNEFEQKSNHTNPHFIWFLYCLHKWYLRWVL